MSICTPPGQFYPVDPQDLVQSTADSLRIDKQRRLEVVVTNGGDVGGDATAANQELEISQLQNANDSLNALEADIDVIRTDTSIIKNTVALASKQDTGNTSLASIDVKLSNPLTINLPSGASTSALQLTGNSTLTTISNTLAAEDFATETTLQSIETTVGIIKDITDATLTVVATSANQVTEINSLSNIDSNTSVLGNIDNNISDISSFTQDVLFYVGSIDNKIPALGQALAAASVPVVLTAAQLITLTPPAAITGFATAAKQDTQITSLSSIDSKLILPASLGQKTKANSLAVTIASDQDILATSALQTTGNASLTSIDSKLTSPLTINLPSGASTSALQTSGNASLTSIDTKTPALGQALAAASTPVVLTAAQLITLTPPAAITGFATETTLASAASDINAIRTNTAAISAKLPSALGQTTMAASLAVTIASNQSALTVDTELPAAAALGDSVSNPTTPMIGAGLMSFGGTNFERVRSGQTSVTSSFTGYVNVLPVGQYLSSLGTLTNGQATPLMVDVNKNLRVIDAASIAILTTMDVDTGNIATSTSAINGKFSTATALADAASTPTTTAVQSCLSTYNGASFDLVRSGLTSGTLSTTGYLNDIPFAKCNTSGVTLGDGFISPLQLDTRGFLKTTQMTGVPTMFRNQAANATLNVKPNPGYFFWMECRNANAAIRYLQIWNSTTTAGIGALVFEMLVPAASNRLIDTFPSTGIFCSTGIAFGFSTTSGTYTGGAAADQVTQIVWV